MSRRDSTRSIKGRIPNSLEIASDSSQGHGFLSVAWLVALEQGVGVVAAGPGQLETHYSPISR